MANAVQLNVLTGTEFGSILGWWVVVSGSVGGWGKKYSDLGLIQFGWPTIHQFIVLIYLYLMQKID